MSLFIPPDQAHINFLMNKPLPPIPARSSLRPKPLTIKRAQHQPTTPDSDITFTELGAGPGPIVQQKLTDSESTFIPPEREALLPPEPDAWLAKKPSMTQSPASADTAVPDTPLYLYSTRTCPCDDPFAEPYAPHPPPTPASPPTTRPATPHTRTASSVYSTASSNAPLHAAQAPRFQHTPTTSTFKRHARKFSANIAKRVLGFMDVRRRCDTGGEEVPPVPPLPTSINRNIGDDDRAHARDPALPVTILGVVHRPDRFAMPAVWERENWHDALARLEGRVREPHPLLVKRGFGEFVEGLVDQVENKNEDDGRELGGRGDAWLSRDNSFVDLWESKQVPAHAVQQPIHRHTRSLSKSTLMKDARLSRIATRERGMMTGSGCVSQLRRGQELLSDDHSPENAVEQNHSVKDTRVKTWVPAVNTVQARRSALRVLDAGRQRRTPDTGTKEAPSMMAMMRDVIADDPNEDEQR